ncbi:MAG: biotin/lipoyl-binding protein, partial [Pseudomonadota bacterium]
MESRWSSGRAALVLLRLVCCLSLLPLGSTASAQQDPLPVDVAQPLVRTIVDWDEYTGRFEAVQRVEIRPRVSGYIESINFEDGQLVKKGDLLLVIDPRPFQTAL